jgi:hypothetical protein
MLPRKPPWLILLNMQLDSKLLLRPRLVCLEVHIFNQSM